MNVEVRLHATLVEVLPGTRAGDPVARELPAGASVAALLQDLGIAPTAVHLILVNGRPVHDRACRLADGDRVALFPAVGGG